MMKRGALIAAPIASFLMVASSNPLEAEDESEFFLQDHGEVNVIRGLEPNTNFEPDTKFEPDTQPEEIDVAPVTAPATQVEPTPPRNEAGPKTTREAALQRSQERGIPTNRAANSGWKPYSLRQRDSRGIPTHRAGNPR